MECCNTVKNNEEALCRLIWEYLKDTLLSRKKVRNRTAWSGMMYVKNWAKRGVYICTGFCRQRFSGAIRKKSFTIKPIGES